MEWKDQPLTDEELRMLKDNVEKYAKDLDDRADSWLINRLLVTIEKLRENANCGCGICLAHNNMQCPKML